MGKVFANMSEVPLVNKFRDTSNFETVASSLEKRFLLKNLKKHFF